MASVVADSICVEFPLYDVKGRSLRHQLARIKVGGSISGAARHVTVRSLDKVSFEAREGDRIGLIGQNGAGKTTLLRTLAEIYEPTSGKLRINGRAAPLFDITLGMDMEANGYENIKLRGLFLGMTLPQIEERMDEIVAFSELGDFLGVPLRTYSAGMLVRVAFAVSTCFAPDILLLDEMIGAGDATFMQKAQERLQRFIASAQIMFLASHSAGVIKNFCNKAMLLHHGKLVAFGDVNEVLARYTEQNAV
jgi:ABC-type polysaccharide/polyol phosphate transport system ATPase subunit